MTTTATPTGTPVTGTMRPVGSFDEWMPLARSSYQRLADAFAAVPDDRWDAPTPCAGWTVRDMGGHMVGAMRSAAKLGEAISQQWVLKRRAKRTGEQEVDAMTAIQIERTADLSNEELVAEMQRLVPAAVAGRQKMPRFVRRRAGFHVEMGAISERWNFDYFLSAILTRDAWLHRVDLADSLGTTLDLDDDDRTIVGDVAVEWCTRHGRPVGLTLTGPAGGSATVGSGGPAIELEAIEFCRIVSGRAEQTHELLEQPVPF